MATTTYGTPYVQSSDLVSAYPGTSSTLATRVDDISLKGNGLNDQTGTTYQLVLTDGGKTVTVNNASPVTVTIPTNTSVSFPSGTLVSVVNKGAGAATIQPAGGVTLNGGNITLAQHAAVQLVKLETNTWGPVDSVGTQPGLAFITSATFTTSSAVNVNDCFSSTYDNYRIIATGTQTTGLERLRLALRSSGSTANTNLEYNAVDTSSSIVRASGSSGDIGHFGSAGSYAIIDIFGPNLASATYANIASAAKQATSGFWLWTGTWVHTTASAYTGFALTPANNSITGTVTVFGYRK